MKNLPVITVLIVVAALIGAAGVFLWPRTEGPDGHGRRAETGEAASVTGATFDRQVLKNPKPVLVDFSAKWCGPCRAMAPKLASLAKDFEVRVVDVDNDGPLANKFGVQSLPSFLIFVKGEEVWRTVGACPESMLRDKMQQFSKQ